MKQNYFVAAASLRRRVLHKPLERLRLHIPFFFGAE